MNTKIEGLLIHKTPYQERHIIGKILLRNGKKVSVVFYGGQGGGTKKKSSVLQLGYMLQIELRKTTKETDLYSAKEWRTIWAHEHIAPTDYKVFYLMCLYLELASKVATEAKLEDPHDEGDLSSEGIFRVLSNGLFQMEKCQIRDGRINSSIHFITYLGKLLLELGVLPDISVCVLCYKDFQRGQYSGLVPNSGGFACSDCVGSEVRSIPDANVLRELLKDILSSKYDEIFKASVCDIDRGLLSLLFNYFLFQFHFNKEDFKSVDMALGQ